LKTRLIKLLARKEVKSIVESVQRKARESRAGKTGTNRLHQTKPEVSKVRETQGQQRERHPDSPAATS